MASVQEFEGQQSKSALGGWAIRAGLSAVVLAVVLWFLPTDEVLAGFAKIPLSLFATVLALFMLGHGLAALKWWALMERVVPIPIALRAHFAGLAANLCLPGVAGGDVARAAIVWKASGDGGKVTAAALGDRLVDMLALALVSAGGLIAYSGLGGSDGMLVAQLIGFFGIAIAGAFYIAPAIIPVLYEKIPALPARGLVLKMTEALRALGRRPVTLLVALGLSVGVQAGFVLLTIWLAEAVGVEAPRAAWFFAWPLAKLLAVLPISLGGIGVREASLAALLTPFGAAAPGVVAASLIWQAVLFVTGLIGAAIWASTPGAKSANVEDVEL